MEIIVGTAVVVIAVIVWAIATFPASIIANRAKYKPLPFFEAEEKKRGDVAINLQDIL